MTDFTTAYVDLLLKQYWEQPNARAEIEAQATTWEAAKLTLESLIPAFDLDTAGTDQLNKIGAIVGLPRDRIEFSDDNEYRFFLAVKIAQNTGSAFMVSDEKVSIQSVILFAFNGLAYVIDNQNMTLTLRIDSTFSITRLLLLIELKLLPKPQAVGYEIIMVDALTPFGYLESDGVFGFSELGVDTFSFDGVDTWDLDGGGDELGITDTADPFLSEVGGIYSELFEA